MDTTRFDKLHIKLFAAIAGAIAVLTLVTYFIFSWSFERGFVDYLNRADQTRLDVMIDRLADGYEREGNWSWIANDRERWMEISREALGLPRAPDNRASGAAAAPRRDTPLTIDPRLMLFDSARRQLIGRTEAAALAVLKPIEVKGSTVGYLGYIPRPEIVESIERVYLQRQRVTFGSIAIGMLAAALALGAGLAYWLTRRVRLLANGTHALIAGDYQVRLDAPGNDELAQLARDFNTLAATLAATREARQQWVADIAHELRTPLAVVRAEIESLEDGVRPLDQTAVASLGHEIVRLSRLVEDLHTLSMSDVGALSYHKEPIALAEAIEDVIDAQRRTIAERGLGVELELDENVRAYADETRLTQVLANLLQNNLRYTEAPGSIAIALRREGPRAVLEWEDSGPGVPTEDLPRLTDRLFRVEGSRSRRGGGAGLGLAIAKAIVEGHGGTLTAYAARIGGLGLRIVLPAVNGAPDG
ncbi:MAG TPA: ATP-binding protein [Burkholderiales bacterium]|nr:ATP-binding protein [Burkholderiales bacterium]